LWRVIGLFVVIVMVYIGQKSSDYYFNHKFYELQFNWHYYAYGLFAFIAYRHLKRKDLKDYQIIGRTFVMALGASTFDEAVQVYISSRIFDISDIGKDGWGIVMGLVIMFFIVNHGEIVKDGWKVRQKKIADYFKNPLSLLVLQAVFVFLLLFNSSLFSDKRYWKEVMGLTIGSFVLFFIILHVTRNKLVKQIVLITLGLAILTQGFFYLKYKDEYLVKTAKGLTIYKGIPIPFYDVIIFQNSSFRVVDKKTYFNARDLNTIFLMKPEILIVTKGFNGKGAKGFIEVYKEWDFVFNEHTESNVQVFTLPNEKARTLFNRLKKEGKNVLLIVHSSY
jgi:VanZ family protein